MELKAIFDEQVEVANIVLTSTQSPLAFNKCCSMFFSVVKPIYRLPLLISVEEGYEDTTDELGFGIGNFKVTSVKNLWNSIAIKIIPLDYSSFDLDNSYVANFQMVCETILRQLDKDNLNMLKGSGIDSIEVQEPLAMLELKEALSKTYKIETGSVIY